MNNEPCIYTLRSMLFEQEESLKACRDKIKALAADNEFLEDLVMQYEKEIDVMVDALRHIKNGTTYPLSAVGWASVALGELGYLTHE